MRKLKIEVFFRNVLGSKMHLGEFYRWFEVLQLPLNQSYEQLREEEQCEYYYNLY